MNSSRVRGGQADRLGHEAARVGDAARPVVGVVRGFHLQRDVLDPESIAQHAAQIVQDVVRRAAIRAHVTAHGVEPAGDRPDVQVVDRFHARHGAHGGFDLRHVEMLGR